MSGPAISTNITELKKASQAEREKAAILEITFDTIPDGIQVLNRDPDLTLWNEQLFNLLLTLDVGDVE